MLTGSQVSWNRAGRDTGVQWEWENRREKLQRSKYRVLKAQAVAAVDTFNCF